MCLARGVPGKRVEYRERRRSHAKRKPDRGRGLAICERHSALEESLHLLFLAWLRLQTYEQCNFDHMSSLSRSRRYAESPSSGAESRMHKCPRLPASHLTVAQAALCSGTSNLLQLRRAATPHTITGPALPNGAPLGPVMYPSLASFKMRNSSVRRPR